MTNNGANFLWTTLFQSDRRQGHHVVTGDFDGDGYNEFLVALRGPMPWQGVFYYKAVDAANRVFVK